MRPHFLLAAAALLPLTAFAQTGAAPAPQAAREPGLYTTINTSMGPITLKLYEKETPITVKNFVDLALGRKAWKDPKTGATVRKPLYNGTTFHRVIPGFMIQGGDPLGNGTGGTTPIRDEFVPTLTFDRPGKLAMANIGRPNTGSCQFFITVAPTPFLNGKHTIFGQVVQGQEIADKISTVPRDADDKPRTPVKILSVTFKREGPAPANDVLGTQRPGAAQRPGARKPAATKKPAPAK